MGDDIISLIGFTIVIYLFLWGIGIKIICETCESLSHEVYMLGKRLERIEQSLYIVPDETKDS